MLTKFKAKKGGSLVEFSLAVALIAVVVITTVKVVGGKTSAKIAEAAQNIERVNQFSEIRTYTCRYDPGTAWTSDALPGVKDVSCLLVIH